MKKSLVTVVAIFALFLFLPTVVSAQTATPTPTAIPTDTPTPTPTPTQTPTGTPTLTPTPIGSCTSVPAIPTLSSVVSNSDNQATLTWADVADPVTNYLVSYGASPGKYTFGDPNIGSQGTTSFTVGRLAGNKKYFFVVAANNNCGTGGFSNEISVVVNPVPATAVPTVDPSVGQTSVSDNSAVSGLVIDKPKGLFELKDAPAPKVSTQAINLNFKVLGIGIMAAGVLLPVSVFIFQKIKKKD
jgi:hypothetical protein